MRTCTLTGHHDGSQPQLNQEYPGSVADYVKRVFARLTEAGLAVEMDLDDQNSPGWKFAEWELRGVPIRVEVGPRDMGQEKAVLVRRDTGEKRAVSVSRLPEEIPVLLEEIQKTLFRRAQDFRDDPNNYGVNYDSSRASTGAGAHGWRFHCLLGGGPSKSSG